MNRISTPLAVNTLADPEPDHEWKVGDPALVPTYTNGDDLSTYVGRYGRRNAANDGFDLIPYEVQALIPYAPPTANPSGWPASVFEWAEVCLQVAEETGQPITTVALRLRGHVWNHRNSVLQISELVEYDRTHG